MNNSIHFKVNGDVLKKAMDVISIVEPRPAPGGDVGYLFKVQGTQCSVYSRNQQFLSRTVFQVDDPQGEGMFVFPKKHVKGFEYFKSGNVTFDATQEGKIFRVSAVGDRTGATGDRATFDWQYVRPCDKEIDQVRQSVKGFTFVSEILSQALKNAKLFLPVASDKADTTSDPKYTIEMYDGSKHDKGDGYLFCTNGTLTYHFHSTEFKGKHFTVHQRAVDNLIKFLDTSGGTVTISEGADLTFAENSIGQIFGWYRAGKSFPGFGYPPNDRDQFVLNVSPSEINEAIDYLKSQMADGDKKVRMSYRDASSNPGDGSIQFQNSEESSPGHGIKSWEVQTKRVSTPASQGSSFDVSMSLESIQAIFRSISSSNLITLRVGLSERDHRKLASIRTIDAIEVQNGESVCKSEVTRFSPQFG